MNSPRRPGLAALFRDPSTTRRQKYYVFVSFVYVLIGLIVIARGAMAQVPIAALLGLVFIGLGAVRLRDFVNWRQPTDGS